MLKAFLTIVGVGLVIEASGVLPAFSMIDAASTQPHGRTKSQAAQTAKSAARRGAGQSIAAKNADRSVASKIVGNSVSRKNTGKSVAHHATGRSYTHVAKSPSSNFFVPPPPPYTPSTLATDYSSPYSNNGANSSSYPNSSAYDASSNYSARSAKSGKSTRLRRPARNQTAYDSNGQKFKKGSLKHRVCSVVAKPFKFLCHPFGHSHKQAQV